MEEIKKTARDLVKPGKGILAADGSPGTIAKRFAPIDLENTESNRRDYRQMLFTSPAIGEYISGVILHDETIRQSTDDGESFVSVLEKAGVIPGIKVDQSTEPFEGSPEEKITKGLEGLPDRLKEYYSMGARFAKWRAVVTIDEKNPPAGGLPTEENLRENAFRLARYAKDCQEAGLVPIVEPEVLMDGNHSILKCREVSGRTLKVLFEELEKAEVEIEGVLLKPNMILPGKESGEKVSPEEVAEATVGLFKEVLPDDLPGVVFLSGGQEEIEATENLNAMHKLGDLPWRMSFSYARALQKSAVEIWKGQAENVSDAQKAFIHRAKMNSSASLGKYSKDLEKV